ncbi:MAG: M50 family metallopeptidase [Oscillospiraceae bacterium]|nr:M50 family metallopeptidase [Oscillospiraceae bacterium]
MLIKSSFKTNISVRFSFLAVVALLTLSETSASVFMSLMSCFLHETGHLLAMFLFGVKVKRIVLYGAGIKIIRGYSLKEKKKEFIILISGCLMNVIMFFLFFFLKGESFKTFAIINLVTAIFNILPIKSLDGGAILLLLTEEKPHLFTFVNILTTIITPLFVVVFTLLFSRFRINPSLIISGIYFFFFSLMDDFSAIPTKTRTDL